MHWKEVTVHARRLRSGEYYHLFQTEYLDKLLGISLHRRLIVYLFIHMFMVV
jgi:hypothetical protein